MEDKPSKQGTAAILYPLLLSLILAGGYYLGTLHTNKTQVEYISNQNGLIKLNRVLNEIELKYVTAPALISLWKPPYQEYFKIWILIRPTYQQKI